MLSHILARESGREPCPRVVRDRETSAMPAAGDPAPPPWAPLKKPQQAERERELRESKKGKEPEASLQPDADLSV